MERHRYESGKALLHFFHYNFSMFTCNKIPGKEGNRYCLSLKNKAEAQGS
jgi:hypothetical protein